MHPTASLTGAYYLRGIPQDGVPHLGFLGVGAEEGPTAGESAELAPAPIPKAGICGQMGRMTEGKVM